LAPKLSENNHWVSLQFVHENYVVDVQDVNLINGYAPSLTCPVNFHGGVGYDLHQSNEKEAVAHRLDAHEAEKKRIARELHDGLGQLLTNIKLRAQLCRSELESSDKPEQLTNAKGVLDDLTGLVGEAIQEVRTVCSRIRPAVLDDLGVLAAICAHCRRCEESASEVSFETAFSLTESDIPEVAKTAIYRIVQEAANNSLKHAKASNIWISLGIDAGRLLLTIEDDGVGFDQEEDRFGFGLVSMRERVEALHGTFNIVSAQGQGVKISASFPMNQPLFF
jgi:two-component system NarL family sensor kinase